MSGRIAIGVDGGGTRTRAAVVGEDGRIMGVGVAGPGNVHDVGVDRVRENIAAALKAAWEPACTRKRRADAAFLGMASCVSPVDERAIRSMAADLDLAPRESVRVDHDLRVALAGGLGGAEGIVLVAGTGSACFGRTADGQSWQAGGWGSVLDDLGSSVYLGVQAMVAAVRDYDGRGKPTVLRTRVLDALGLRDMSEILHRVEARGLTRMEKATLASLVTRAAEEGDEVALEVIARGADELAWMVATVERKLDLASALSPVPVAVAGGLTGAGRVFMEPLRAALTRRCPACQPVEPLLTPALGAALLALETLGIEVTAKLVARLRGGFA